MKCAGRLKHTEEISSGPGELTKGDGMRHKLICAAGVVSLAVLFGNAALEETLGEAFLKGDQAAI